MRSGLDTRAMRLLAIACVSLFAGAAPDPSTDPSPPRGAVDASDPSDPWALDWLDSTMSELVARREVPGMAWAFVHRGRVAAAGAHGVASVDTGEPVSIEETRFAIGSITKVLTTIAALRLVEEGPLSLDHPVREYLDFPPPWGHTGPPVTLHDLLTHTAGFEVEQLGIARRRPAELPALGEYVRTAMRRRPYPPGRIRRYSNYGFGVAGYLVQRASGLPYERYMTERVLRPLGMDRTGFEAADRAEAGRAAPHYCEARECRSIPRAYSIAPAAGLVSTVADLARLVAALLDHGSPERGRVLERESLERMSTRQFPPGAPPADDGATYGLFSLRDGTARVVTAPGWMGGASTKLILYPDENAGFVVFGNAGRIGGIGHRLRTEIRRRRDARPGHDPRVGERPDDRSNGPSITDRRPDAEIDALVGRYRSMNYEGAGLGRFGRLVRSRELVVDRTESGGLVAARGARSYTLDRIRRRLYRATHVPHDYYFNFVDVSGDGRVDHVSVSDEEFERITAWGRPSVHMGVVTGIASALSSFLVLWSIAWAFGRLRGGGRRAMRQRPGSTIAPAGGALLLGIACALELGSLAAIHWWTSGPQANLLAFGIPPGLQLVRWLPLAVLVLVPWLLACAGVAWSRGYWSVSARVHYSGIVLTAILFLPYAAYLGILPL